VTVGFHILLFSYAALHSPAKILRRESDTTAQFLTVFSLALPEFLPAGSILQQKTNMSIPLITVSGAFYPSAVISHIDVWKNNCHTAKNGCANVFRKLKIRLRSRQITSLIVEVNGCNLV
jgi:hypothetical protein